MCRIKLSYVSGFLLYVLVPIDDVTGFVVEFFLSTLSSFPKYVCEVSA
jgi:hypothetical protein